MSVTLEPSTPAAPAGLDFDALYRGARDDVYAYVVTLLRSRAAAEDVTAQTFERAFRKARSYDPAKGGPRAWLFGIARHAALDELRRNKRIATLVAEPVDAATATDEAAERALQRAAVRNALAELPPRDRELIALKFHAGLDTRAAAGFSRPPRRSPWAVLKAHRRALVPVVGFACVALLVVALAARPREIERVAAGILRVTDAAGGFVASSTVSTGGGSYELRIPTRRLGKALGDLSRLAKVRERTQSSQDITAETVSARERLRERQREREGLLRALANATTLNETEAVKARLRTVDREIASARASLRRVVNRASYANVSVQLVADRGGAAAPAEEDRWTPGDALRDAARVLEVVAGVAVVALALLLPFALIGALGMLGARLAGRRRRERALDMA